MASRYISFSNKYAILSNDVHCTTKSAPIIRATWKYTLFMLVSPGENTAFRNKNIVKTVDTRSSFLPKLLILLNAHPAAPTAKHK